MQIFQPIGPSRLLGYEFEYFTLSKKPAAPELVKRADLTSD